MVEPAAIPVGEFLYRSSLPIEIPATRDVKASPYWAIAALRAVNSLGKAVPEAQRVTRREMSSAMAAGMAEVGSLVVPA